MFMERSETRAARAERELEDRRRAYDAAAAAAEASGPEADVVELIDCALALQAAESVAAAVPARSAPG
jgi:hypothetical protein